MGDRAERTRGLVEHPHDVGLLRHVALDHDGRATGLLHRAGDLRRRIGAAEEIDRDVITALGRKPCRRRANTAAAAGDEKNGSRHGELPDLRRYPGWCRRRKPMPTT